jgi:hypothetical protein
MQFSPGFLTLFIAASSTWCCAQAFNVDAGGNSSTLPPAEYGASASQSGFWNSIGSSSYLSGLDGSSTGVLCGSGYGGALNLEIEGDLGDDKLLMDSALAGSPLANAATFLFLQPCLYDVYVYCWAGNLLGPKDVTIRAFTGAGQVVGGVSYVAAWPGGQILGETYDRLRVEVTAGNNEYLDIFIQAPGDFNVINGIQLVPVPAPASMALPVIGAMVVPRRRR